MDDRQRIPAFLRRIAQALQGPTAEASPAAGGASAAPAAPVVWVAVDGERGRVTAELLRLQGLTVRTGDEPALGARLAVTQPGHAAAALASDAAVPLVLVDVSGPSAVMGRLARARILRYLPRGASALEVARTTSALAGALRERERPVRRSA